MKDPRQDVIEKIAHDIKYDWEERITAARDAADLAGLSLSSPESTPDFMAQAEKAYEREVSKIVWTAWRERYARGPL